MDVEREPPPACPLGTYAPPRKTMTPELLQDVLDKHSRWVRGLAGGACANLSLANLEGLDLSKVDLRWANLGGAKLARAHLAVLGLRRRHVLRRSAQLRPETSRSDRNRSSRRPPAFGRLYRSAPSRRRPAGRHADSPADGSPLNLATMPRAPRLSTYRCHATREWAIQGWSGRGHRQHRRPDRWTDAGRSLLPHRFDFGGFTVRRSERGGPDRLQSPERRSQPKPT